MKLTIAISALLLSIPSLCFADRAPQGYELLQSSRDFAFRYTENDEPVRRGNVAERIELRDGYCSGTDCKPDRLRSEIRIPKRRALARYGQDIWFGWSFLIEEMSPEFGYVGVYPFLGQWKTAPENSPTIVFMMGGSGSRKDEIHVTLDDMRRVNGGYVQGIKNGHVCKNMFTVRQAKSEWQDIVINTNFSRGDDGYLNVWINGQLKCEYRGQIVGTQSSSDYRGPNHRRGVYIGNTTRWRAAKGDEPIPPVIVYYDEFLHGASREEVDTRLREAAGLPAKD